MKKIITLIFCLSVLFINSQTGVVKPAWLLSGNPGTSTVTQFMGTTDAKPVNFRTNNLYRGQLGTDGILYWGGTTANATGFGNVRLMQGTSRLDIGELSAGTMALWSGGTNSSTNWLHSWTNTVNRMNALVSLGFNTGGTNRMTLTSGALTFTTGTNLIVPSIINTPSLTAPTSSNLTINAPTGQSIDFRINNSNTAQMFSTATFFSTNVRIGSFTTPTVALDVTGACSISSTFTVNGAATFNNLINSASDIIANGNIQVGSRVIPVTAATDLNLSTRATSTANVIFSTITTTTSAGESARINNSGQLGIGTGSTIAASAKVQITSTTQGFLPPVMTATQGSAIASPAQGLIIYVNNTNGTFTAKGWWGYDGAAWQKLNN